MEAKRGWEGVGLNWEKEEENYGFWREERGGAGLGVGVGVDDDDKSLVCGSYFSSSASC